MSYLHVDVDVFVRFLPLNQISSDILPAARSALWQIHHSINEPVVARLGGASSR